MAVILHHSDDIRSIEIAKTKYIMKRIIKLQSADIVLRPNGVQPHIVPLERAAEPVFELRHHDDMMYLGIFGDALVGVSRRWEVESVVAYRSGQGISGR